MLNNTFSKHVGVKLGVMIQLKSVDFDISAVQEPACHHPTRQKVMDTKSDGHKK